MQFMPMQLEQKQFVKGCGSNMEIRFKLNPNNDKDKIIINVLAGEYSPAETIKNMLYKMGLSGNEVYLKQLGGLNDNLGKSEDAQQLMTIDIKGIVGQDKGTPNNNDNGQSMELDEDIANFFN